MLRVALFFILLFFSYGCSGGGASDAQAKSGGQAGQSGQAVNIPYDALFVNSCNYKWAK